MDELEFTLELNSEDLPKAAEYKLYAQAEERLRSLAADHNDMVGAAINVRRPASGQSAFLHEVTVVIYGRPEHIAATEKNASPEQALKGALDAAERQVRKRRKKLKERWKRPGNHPVEQEIGETYIAEEEDVNEDIEEIEDELDET
ncbi:MAG: HPF/RaiA family ribosome-associated protein [Anaerolineaceae bacterium]|nr:HPF/RaiA family ribosome-associated protein [Anaerolineaceae bacterium]